MKFIAKTGQDQLFLIAHKEPGETIINLRERWPERVEFNRKTGELEIQVRTETPLIRLRPSHPIEVDGIDIEKDQVVVSYRRLELTHDAGPSL